MTQAKDSMWAIDCQLIFVIWFTIVLGARKGAGARLHKSPLDRLFRRAVRSMGAGGFRRVLPGSIKDSIASLLRYFGIIVHTNIIVCISKEPSDAF